MGNVKLTIKRQDNSVYWEETFSSHAEADAWLAEESSMPYWDQSFIAIKEDEATTPLAQRPVRPVDHTVVPEEYDYDYQLEETQFALAPLDPILRDKEAATGFKFQALHEELEGVVETKQLAEIYEKLLAKISLKEVEFTKQSPAVDTTNTELIKKVDDLKNELSVLAELTRSLKEEIKAVKSIPVEVPSAPTYMEVPSAPTYVEVPSAPTYVEVPTAPTYVEVPTAPTYVEVPSAPTYINIQKESTADPSTNTVCWSDFQMALDMMSDIIKTKASTSSTEELKDLFNEIEQMMQDVPRFKDLAFKDEFLAHIFTITILLQTFTKKELFDDLVKDYCAKVVFVTPIPEIVNTVNGLSETIVKVKDSLLALATKLDSEDVTNLDTDYLATVNAELLT